MHVMSNVTSISFINFFFQFLFSISFFNFFFQFLFSISFFSFFFQFLFSISFFSFLFSISFFNFFFQFLFSVFFFQFSVFFFQSISISIVIIDSSPPYLTFCLFEITNRYGLVYNCNNPSSTALALVYGNKQR